MIAKLLVSILIAQGAVCSGSEALIPDDTVSLLQAHVEVAKRNEAKASADSLIDDEPSDYGVEKVCDSKLTEGTPQKNDGVEQKAPEAATQQETESAADEASKGPLNLGTVLQAIACLLIMDVMRRCSSKGKTGKAAPQKNSTKASSTQSSVPSSGLPPSLLTAALAGDEAAFEAQISSCSSQLSRVDSWGCSVLHYAAKGGSAGIINRLLDRGVAVDALDAWDETPLHLAARAGHQEACEILLDAGADIEAFNAEECPPLIVAGRADKEAVCRLLISRGAGIAGLPSNIVPDLVTGLLPAAAA